VRVCHVCSAHDDDDSRVFHRACVSLAKAGYEVHLIAASARKGPYVRDGVQVHPLPATRGRAERLARRTRVAELARRLEPDLFHVHEPELLGPVVKRSAARPVIWDVHESYLDVAMAREWIPRVARPLVREVWDRRERSLLAQCAAVVTATEPIAKRYRPLHARVSVIANYPTQLPLERPVRSPSSPQACVFAGSLSPDRGLYEVLEALSILRPQGTTVRLNLAGQPACEEFLEGLFDRAGELGVRDLVTYHGVLSKDEVAEFYRRGTIGVVTYLPTGNSVAGLPTKLLECMRSGLPVVFSNFPIYREMAGVTGAGIAVDPTNANEIAAAIERLVSDPSEAAAMGERGFAAVRDRFNWEAERPKLLQLYSELL
jgi:glycosyltransferase involved in cell wall biosynthesis